MCVVGCVYVCVYAYGGRVYVCVVGCVCVVECVYMCVCVRVGVGCVSMCVFGCIGGVYTCIYPRGGLLSVGSTKGSLVE